MYTTTHTTDSSFSRNGCRVWGQLHGEREDVCAALLAEGRPVSDTTAGLQETEPLEETAREEWKHRELLQARLRLIDDALDRLMAGAYGRCSQCGRPIEQERLTDDPAVSFCLVCQKGRLNTWAHREGQWAMDPGVLDLIPRGELCEATKDTQT